MLGAYDVRYMPRTAIKGQVLTNFVTEFTESAASEGKETVDVMTASASVIPSGKCTPMEQLTEKGQE